ncbi:MAG TPA: twin-arginine translocase TatA/TatE family subunit [Anaerolineales bacterium]|nr:twin-arginine translocase TatA/TatE family subunit [Anaerolineales bacterium]HNN13124.1 twin-arginine translocase TatA/TatE family subunit [Anaerolineales bacterium]HNO32605.1 twin-arginine translocase TatA/TatE family subunit [Anaerolineales bacterium]
MEILGVGMPELVFVLIIAILLLGPKDMEKAGRTIGKWLRAVVTSDGWKIFQQTSRELRTLPNKLMREANDELNQIGRDLNSASKPTPQRPGPPNMPSRSQPFPETPPVVKDKKAEQPNTEHSEPESDPNPDA